MADFLGNLWNDITGVTASNNALDYQRQGALDATAAMEEANAAALAASQGYGDQSLSALSGANTNALSSMQQGYDSSQNYLTNANNQAQGYLTSGLSQLGSSMDPYMTAGTNALNQQQALSGGLGADAQQAAYDAIQNSPMFQASVQQGNDAILQNAAATGGVRGGNTQGVLAQYAPQMLADAVNQQYSQLSGLSNMGYGASSQYGQGALGTGQSQASLASQLGTNQADLASQLGLNQADLQNQLGMSQANIYSNLGNTEAGILSGQGTNEANLISGLADAQAGNEIGNYQLQSDAVGNIIDFGFDVGGLLMGGVPLSSLLNAGGNALSGGGTSISGGGIA